MCEASVSSADPAGCGWWPARGSRRTLHSHCPLEVPARGRSGWPYCCPAEWHPRGLPSSSISPLGSAPGSSEPGALLYTRPLLCLFPSLSGCVGEGSPTPHPTDTCPALFLSHAFCHQETTHFSPRAGAGRARMDEWQECRLCPSHPSPRRTKPRIPLLPSSFVPFSTSVPPSVRTAWELGSLLEPALGVGARPRKLHPYHVLPHGGALQGCSRAAGSNLATVEKLTKSSRAVHGSLDLSLFLIFNKTNPERCIRFV